MVLPNICQCVVRNVRISAPSSAVMKVHPDPPRLCTQTNTTFGCSLEIISPAHLSSRSSPDFVSSPSFIAGKWHCLRNSIDRPPHRMNGSRAAGRIACPGSFCRGAGLSVATPSTATSDARGRRHVRHLLFGSVIPAVAGGPSAFPYAPRAGALMRDSRHDDRRAAEWTRPARSNTSSRNIGIA